MVRAALAVYPDQRQEIIDFMSGFSLETTPASAIKVPDFREHVRQGDDVYITFLPGSSFEETITVAKRLRLEGFNPVPHLAARGIADRNAFERTLRRLRDEAAVSKVLLIGGDIAEPVGEFSDTMQLL
jgi:methylenetetrahydrofolate reductase (NADPH)